LVPFALPSPENPVQVSPLGSTYYTPVQPTPPVPPVKGKDNDGDNDNGSGADDKPKPAKPPGVGTLLDISA
jgi:hypothetical protein